MTCSLFVRLSNQLGLNVCICVRIVDVFVCPWMCEVRLPAFTERHGGFSPRGLAGGFFPLRNLQVLSITAGDRRHAGSERAKICIWYTIESSVSLYVHEPTDCERDIAHVFSL